MYLASNDLFINDKNFIDMGNPDTVVIGASLVIEKDNWEEIAIVDLFNHTVHEHGLVVSVGYVVAESGILFVAVADQLDCIEGDGFHG